MPELMCFLRQKLTWLGHSIKKRDVLEEFAKAHFIIKQLWIYGWPIPLKGAQKFHQELKKKKKKNTNPIKEQSQVCDAHTFNTNNFPRQQNNKMMQ